VELRELAENFRRMLPPPATEGSAAAGAGKADGILDSLRMDLKIGDWMRDIASKHGGGGPCRVPDGGAVAAGLEERQHEIFLRGRTVADEISRNERDLEIALISINTLKNI